MIAQLSLLYITYTSKEGIARELREKAAIVGCVRDNRTRGTSAPTLINYI